MEYKASFDSLTKAITVCISLLFLGVIFFNLKIMSGYHHKSQTLIHVGVILLLLSIFSGSYLFSTRGYVVGSGYLVIRRPVGEKKIPLSEISETRNIDRKEMFGTIRTFGNGGLFGYYGKFYNGSLGSMTLYTTQRKNRVLIILKTGKKIVVSPDDPGFVDRLKAEMR